jgi:hypothetical protein
MHYKLLNDGAGFRCTECDVVKPHSQVILFEHSETHARQVICLGCVDPEWLAGSECKGEL